MRAIATGTFQRCSPARVFLSHAAPRSCLLSAASNLAKSTQPATPLKRLSTTHKLFAQSKTGQKTRQYEPLPQGWEAIIGVEVHAQLKSRRKLFSGARTMTPQVEAANDFGNTRVTAFDASLPGTLPSLDEEPLRLAVKSCLALDCTFDDIFTFDRKHYFYADLTSGYQITQKYCPLGKNGHLNLLFDDGHLPTKEEEVEVRIEQIQLEQDTAKSTHGISENEGHVTLVDLNRGGSALIEIVSGPDMRTPEQAGAYIRKLRSTLRQIGASDGNMEDGSLRCDVNVSVHRRGEPWGLRSEVKNLNSIKFVMNAITFEMHRQQKAIQNGEVLEQETRGYDEPSATTHRLRAKEDAPDYRYMPDPNLPAFHLDTSTLVEEVKSSLPELPDAQRARLVLQYGIGIREANVLIRIGLGDETDSSSLDYAQSKDSTASRGESQDAVQYFEALAQERDGKVAVNWLIQDLLKELNASGKTFAQNRVRAADFKELIDLVQSRKITLPTGRALLSELAASDDGGETVLGPHRKGPASRPVEALLIARDALALGSDNDALTLLCNDVVDSMPEEVGLIRRGKDKIVMRLVGEVMKRTKGRADARAAQDVLIDLIRKRAE